MLCVCDSKERVSEGNERRIPGGEIWTPDSLTAFPPRVLSCRSLHLHHHLTADHFDMLTRSPPPAPY